MSNRDAVSTINGYFYQFDYSISRLLELKNDEDLITIEGVEDVDIKSLNEETAIQCKYYAKTEYNHSTIAKPIRLMLNHFKEVKIGTKTEINYYLYGYYKTGQYKLPLPLTKDFLIEHFLTYKKEKVIYYHHNELGLTSQDLDEFIEKLTIDINATSYSDQTKHIFTLLEKHFKCSRFEAEHYYYNNALKVIKEVAVKFNVVNRTISKKEFIANIDNKSILFNEWFSLYKGKKEFLSNIKKEYFTGLNTSPFERFFLIEVSSNDYLRFEIKELLLMISKKWSNISRRMQTPFCPYVYIHNITEKELVELKKEFHDEGINFLDGFSYQGATFSSKVMHTTANSNNQIMLKILNDIEHVQQILSDKIGTREVYEFYLNEPYFKLNDPSIKYVSIQCEQTKDIKEII